jgi:hypothetical protein
VNKLTSRADFYDDLEAMSPSRSMIISALSEEQAVGAATAMMGDAARTEFSHAIDRN